MENLHIELLTDKMNIRWLKILNAFERNSELTSEDLSKITHSTARTVIRDVANIKLYFDEMILIDATRSGYRFTELYRVGYVLKKKQILKYEPIFNIIHSIYLGERRKKISELSAEYYLSERTMMKMLKKLRTIALDYGFNLSYKPLDFVGSEENIRKFFLDFFYEGDVIPHTLVPSEDVQIISKKFLLHKNIEFLTIQSSKFYYLLMIGIERTKQNFLVTISEKVKKIIIQDSNYKYAQELNGLIMDQVGFMLPEDELIYLTILWLINKNIIDEEQSVSLNNFDNEYLIDISQQYCAKGSLNLDTKLIHTFFVSNYLKNLISPVYVRNTLDLNIYIKKYHERDFFENLKFFKKNKVSKIIFDEKIFEDLAVNLTLFMNSLKIMNNPKQLNIGFLLEGNQYLCLNIQATALKYLGKGQNIHILNIQTFNEQFIKEKAIDFVVSNYAEYVNNNVLNLEYVLFKSLPTPDDWRHLMAKINTDRMSKEIF